MSDTILLVEDDEEMARLIGAEAERRGLELQHVPTISLAVAKLRHSIVSLIVLDLSLPDGDGLELLKSIRREDNKLPLIILSSRRDEIDRVLGLELGADDFVSKPFSVRELFARIAAQLRRSHERGESAKEAEGTLLFGPLEINLTEKSVWNDGRRIDLTPIEFRLLSLLALHPGRTYSREDLFKHVWGYNITEFDHTVTSHMSRLRAKVETDPARPVFIKTVHGIGYRFVERAEIEGEK